MVPPTPSLVNNQRLLCSMFGTWHESVQVALMCLPAIAFTQLASCGSRIASEKSWFLGHHGCAVYMKQAAALPASHRLINCLCFKVWVYLDAADAFIPGHGDRQVHRRGVLTPCACGLFNTAYKIRCRCRQQH